MTWKWPKTNWRTASCATCSPSKQQPHRCQAPGVSSEGWGSCRGLLGAPRGNPSSASYLSTFSPGRRWEINPPSPKGEGGGHAPPGEGSLRQPIAPWLRPRRSPLHAAVTPAAEEFHKAHVAQDLQLLPDFVKHVPVVGMQFFGVRGEGVNFLNDKLFLVERALGQGRTRFAPPRSRLCC